MTIKFKQKWEDFLYKKIIRNILLTSKLGRQSVLGEASTGYNFDHMYTSQAEGFYGIGKIVDFVLLRLPAVKATKARKQNIVRILSDEVQALLNKSTRPHILDVACGAGRYLAELKQVFKNENLDILGVDYDRKSLNLGKEIASGLDLQLEDFRYVRGNIFKLSRLKSLGNKKAWVPNIVVASGLIVYMPDDTAKSVIGQVYDTLSNGGLFLFSSQQNNPSRKLMEKVCNTKDGAWMLYYRQPTLICQWLTEFGFKDIKVNTDPWGMYNLYMARR